MSSRDLSIYDQSYDDEVLARLAGRVEELEFELTRARHRVRITPIAPLAVAFGFELITFLLSLTITVWPYLHVSGPQVPTVISYVSAFVVLCFAYFAYSTYQTLNLRLEYNRAVRMTANDGEFVLSRARDVMKRAEEESSLEKADSC